MRGVQTRVLLHLLRPARVLGARLEQAPPSGVVGLVLPAESLVQCRGEHALLVARLRYPLVQLGQRLQQTRPRSGGREGGPAARAAPRAPLRRAPPPWPPPRRPRAAPPPPSRSRAASAGSRGAAAAPTPPPTTPLSETKADSSSRPRARASTAARSAYASSTAAARWRVSCSETEPRSSRDRAEIGRLPGCGWSSAVRSSSRSSGTMSRVRLKQEYVIIIIGILQLGHDEQGPPSERPLGAENVRVHVVA